MFKVETLAAIFVYIVGTVLVYAGFAFIEFELNPFYWYMTTRVLLVLAQIGWGFALVMAARSDD